MRKAVYALSPESITGWAYVPPGHAPRPGEKPFTFQWFDGTSYPKLGGLYVDPHLKKRHCWGLCHL